MPTPTLLTQASLTHPQRHSKVCQCLGEMGMGWRGQGKEWYRPLESGRKSLTSPALCTQATTAKTHSGTAWAWLLLLRDRLTAHWCNSLTGSDSMRLLLVTHLVPLPPPPRYAFGHRVVSSMAKLAVGWGYIPLVISLLHSSHQNTKEHGAALAHLPMPGLPLQWKRLRVGGKAIPVHSFKWVLRAGVPYLALVMLLFTAIP